MALDTNSLSDADLTKLCMVDQDIDPNCACLLSGGGPEMNTDISGPGVRISFYLQALFLGLMTARSASVEENTGALYTLISTNVAMVVTSFILGFKSEPGMSLHDAIVVFYLLALSWTAIFFSLPTYNRFKRRDVVVQVLYMFHSYLVFAFFVAVLITAPTFGSTTRCNSHAVAVIFRNVPALSAGRVVCFVLVALVIVIYSVLIMNDYKHLLSEQYNKSREHIVERYHETRGRITEQYGKIRGRITERFGNIRERLRTGKVTHATETVEEVTDTSQTQQAEASRALQTWGLDNARRACPAKSKGEKLPKHTKDEKTKKRDGSQGSADGDSYEVGVYGRLVAELIVVVVLWAIFVMNAELLIVRNRFEGGGDGIGSNLWGFGQVLPMFLVVLPMVNLIKTFKKYKLSKRQHRRPLHRTHLPAGFQFGGQESGHDHHHGSRHGHTHAYGRGFDQGPRPPPRSWTGNWCSTRHDFMSPFSRSFGQQPAAHISVNSLHSDASNYDTYANTTKWDKGKGRAEPSVPLTSASESSLLSYVTADEAV